MRHHNIFLLDVFRLRNRIFHRFHDLRKGLILHGRFRDQSHIPGAGIMIFIVKAVGVYKMGVYTAQLLRLLVHHLNKAFLRTADLLRHRVGAVVGRYHDDRIQSLPERELFSRVHPQAAAVLIQAVYRPVRDFYLTVQISVFQRGLTVHQRQVAVADAGLHAVAFDHQIKVAGRVFHTGIFHAVVFFKCQRAEPGPHGAHHRDRAFFITAEKALGGGRRLDSGKTQQIVAGGAQQRRKAAQGFGVRRGTPGLPFANRLLAHSQLHRQALLAEAAALSQFL